MSKLYFQLSKKVIDRILSKHKNADYQIRIISLREVNRLRRQGIKVYILGAIDRIAVKQKQVPIKLKRFATLNGSQPLVRHNGRIICSYGGNDSQGDNEGNLDVFSSSGIDSGGRCISISYDNVNDEFVVVIVVKPRNGSDKTLLKSLSQRILQNPLYSTETDNDKDRALVDKLSLYIKGNDDVTDIDAHRNAARHFLNSVRTMKDNQIINYVKQLKEKRCLTGTSKGLWSALHEVGLYRKGYSNWNEQLNKR